jgi:hypothetical protein
VSVEHAVADSHLRRTSNDHHQIHSIDIKSKSTEEKQEEKYCSIEHEINIQQNPEE